MLLGLAEIGLRTFADSARWIPSMFFKGKPLMSDTRRELAEFVIRKAFDPVLHAKPDGKSEADRRTLEHVQRATRAEIERYRKYGSAQEVATNFNRDLTSEAAKKVHAQLRHLHLPTIDDIKDEFKSKARDLGVT